MRQLLFELEKVMEQKLKPHIQNALYVARNRPSTFKKSSMMLRVAIDCIDTKTDVRQPVMSLVEMSKMAHNQLHANFESRTKGRWTKGRRTKGRRTKGRWTKGRWTKRREIHRGQKVDMYQYVYTYEYT